MNFYEILGIDRNATIIEIKKAFKQKSFQNHPDKGGNEEFAKNLSEAYHTLSDQNLRKKYDSQIGPNHLYVEIKYFDKYISEEISLRESLHGCEKSIFVDFGSDSCPMCGGTGCKQPGIRIPCDKCQGRGIEFNNNIKSFNIKPCQKCSGRKLIPMNPCRKCSGDGKIFAKKKIKFKIPAGISNERVVKLNEIGTEIGVCSLYITIKIMIDEEWIREDNDLIKFVKIDSISAMLGCEISFLDLYDREINLLIPPGTQLNSRIELDEFGVLGSNGCFYGNIQILIPKLKTLRAKKLAEELAEELELSANNNQDSTTFTPR